NIHEKWICAKEDEKDRQRATQPKELHWADFKSLCEAHGKQFTASLAVPNKRTSAVLMFLRNFSSSPERQDLLFLEFEVMSKEAGQDKCWGDFPSTMVVEAQCVQWMSLQKKIETQGIILDEGGSRGWVAHNWVGPAPFQ
ncbi:hypothetical protein LTS03_012083, partial [Exophiala xenobiotica]